MTRYTLHVPLFLNDGAPTEEAALERVEIALANIAGGWTATDGLGGWLSADGAYYREPVRLYAIDTDAPNYALPQLHRLADWLAIELQQQAVYLTWSEIGAQLVSPVPVT